MKALVQDRYGPPDRVLELRQVDKPTAASDEVVVRVRAASIHPDIWHAVTGRPFILRLMGSGLWKPRESIPGIDLAGVIDTVGSDVTEMRPGDEVFGGLSGVNLWRNGGTYAEYVAISPAELRPKPPGITFEQAAAIPASGKIALDHIRHARVSARDRVVVNGAGGGVGTMAVQLAKAEGAHVTAVDATGKSDMLRALGADRVLDYTQEDFTQVDVPYDVIIDVPGNRSIRDLRRALAERGRYVLIAHDDFGRRGGRLFGSGMPRILRLLVTDPFGRRRRKRAPALEPVDMLTELGELVAVGKLTPQIDRVFPLEQAVEAIDHLVSGQALGKIIISI